MTVTDDPQGERAPGSFIDLARKPYSDDSGANETALRMYDIVRSVVLVF